MRVMKRNVQVIARERQVRIRALHLAGGHEPERLPEAARRGEVGDRQAHFGEVTAHRDLAERARHGRVGARLEHGERVAEGVLEADLVEDFLTRVTERELDPRRGELRDPPRDAGTHEGEHR
jgi:hypothetical protein